MTGRALDKFAWEKQVRGADLTHAERTVLWMLSTYASGDLTNARPGLDELYWATRTRPQTVKSALRSLVAKGWLEVAKGGGRGRATVYTLTVPQGRNRDGERTELETENRDAHRSGSAPETGTVDGENRDGKRLETGTVDGRKQERSPSHHQSSYQITTSEEDHSSRHLSTAGAGARMTEPQKPKPFDAELGDATEPAARAVVDEGPDPETNPLAWLDRKLPQGFWAGERARAQELLAAGDSYSKVYYAIAGARHPSRPARSFGRRLLEERAAPGGAA